jgi:capsular polysaccharide biosynthesis protein
LNETIINVLNNKNFDIIELDKVIFIKFTHTNVGHAFANIMNIIYQLKEINLTEYKIIITEDLVNCSSFLISIIYLFFNDSQIIVINDTTLVKFNKTFIIDDILDKQQINVDILINKLKVSSIISNIKTFDNIFLIKSTITKNTNPLNKSFNNEYNEYFIEKGFNCIIPENYDINTLYKIINNAKNIIMSWGCCSYLNSIFVNPNSNVLVLCHIGYKTEYYNVINKWNINILDSAWFPTICNKKLILYDLESKFNDNIKMQLDDKILELK